MQDSLKRLEGYFIPAVLIFLMWLAMPAIEFPLPTQDLDSSWRQAIDYAFLNQFQAGVDWIFTYGPLGILHHSASYHPDLIVVYLSWQIGGMLLIASLFSLKGMQFQSSLNRFFFFALFIILLVHFRADGRYFLVITGLASLALFPPDTLAPLRRYWGLLAVILSLFAILALIKFTNLALVGFSVIVISSVLAITRSWWVGVLALLGFVGIFVGLWALTGQSIEHIPAYIMHSLHMSRAYSETMALSYIHSQLLLALAYIGVIASMLLLAVLTAQRKIPYLGLGLIISAGLFLATKTGFVRHDAHVLIFFGFAALMPWFLVCDKNSHALWQFLFGSLRYAAVSIGIIGIAIAQAPPINLKYAPFKFMRIWNQNVVINAQILITLPQLLETRRQQINQLKQTTHALPETRKQVGDAPIDLVSWSQTNLLLNELNWRPRPIFQSYAAYTPELMRINGEFYASSMAPEYVLWKFQIIDQQLPLMSDAEVYKLLLRDYKPLITEKGYVLLQRQPRGEGLVQAEQVLLQETVTANTRIDLAHLNHQPLLLKLDLTLSLEGELLKFLYRLPPTIYLDVIFDEGGQEIVSSYRILPSMMKTGVLINPFLGNQNDLYKWYSQSPLDRVKAIVLRLQPEWIERLFHPDIQLEIASVALSPYNLSDSKRQAFQAELYPGLGATPYLVTRPNQDSTEAGQPVLMVHSPGEVQYQLAAGDYQLDGEFGILQGAYAVGNPSPTDGVTFAVVLRQAKEETVLFSRTLTPLNTATDQGIQRLATLPIKVDTPSQVILKTDPFITHQSDWSFWRGIRFTTHEVNKGEAGESDG